MSTDIATYIKSVGTPRRFTRGEEAKMVRKMRRGDRDAREQLIMSVLPYAVQVAKKSAGYAKSLTVDELISCANTGVIRAVDKLDPRKGRLTTIATHYMLQEIRWAIHHAKTIRSPAHYYSGGGTYTKEHLATRNISHMGDGVLWELESPTRAPDQNMSDEEGEDEADEAIQDMIESLLSHGESDRNVNILIDYLGTDKTLKQVGEEYGVSRERIRQIVNRLSDFARLLRKLSARKKRKWQAVGT